MVRTSAHVSFIEFSTGLWNAGHELERAAAGDASVAYDIDNGFIYALGGLLILVFGGDEGFRCGNDVGRVSSRLSN